WGGRAACAALHQSFSRAGLKAIDGNSVPPIGNTSRWGSSPSFVDSQIDCLPFRSTTKPSARPLGWGGSGGLGPAGPPATDRPEPSPTTRFGAPPAGSANTTASPSGWPQSRTV